MQVFSFQPDYKGMRIITDELYAALIAHLAKDEKVSLFQQLLLSEQKGQGQDDHAEVLAGDVERGGE